MRYTVMDQVHHRRPDGKVRTLQRWDALGAARPCVRLVELVDGVETSRTSLTSTTALEALPAVLLAARRHDGQLTDEEARADITARTGRDDQAWCYSGDCGSPIPLGTTRCLRGHSTGRVAAGALTGARRRGPLVLRTGSRSDG